MEGARENCPFIQWPHLSFRQSPSAEAGSRGPSMSGASASPEGRRLPDLEMSGSGKFWTSICWALLFLLRRRRRPVMGEALREGLRGLDLAGERPLTTSSFRAEKKPCFFSISQTAGQPAEAENSRQERGLLVSSATSGGGSTDPQTEREPGNQDQEKDQGRRGEATGSGNRCAVGKGGRLGRGRGEKAWAGSWGSRHSPFPAPAARPPRPLSPIPPIFLIAPPPVSG